MMAGVQTLWAAVAFVLLMMYLLLIGRIVVDITRSFARSWRPEGVTAVGLELMYSATDPPVRLLRRLIPPLRLGPISLDLSVVLLLIAILLMRTIALQLALG
jgi:YggT family protein